MTTDVADLEVKIRRMDENVSKLHSARHAQELLRVIHKPGWTTVAEAALVNAMVDSLLMHMDNVHRAHDTLLSAARQVGEASICNC
jgi:hypothetical protein